MKKLIAVLALLIILSLFAAPMINAQYVVVSSSRTVFIYASCFDPEQNLTGTLKELVNSSSIYIVVPQPPYTPLYGLLSLVNGSWSLDKGIPANVTLILGNGSRIYPYKIIDQKHLQERLGKESMLIAVQGINPEYFNYSSNPYYNITKQYIPPQSIVVPINGTGEWRLLDTSISVYKITGGYRLVIKGYVNILVSNETYTTPIVKLNITKATAQVAAGVYWLKFHLIPENNEVLVITLGTREPRTWIGKNYSEFHNPVTPWLPPSFAKTIGFNATKWALKEVASFYISLAGFMYSYTKSRFITINYPVIYNAYLVAKALGLDEKQTNELLQIALDGLNKILDTTRNKLGADTSILIYSSFNKLPKPQEIKGTIEVVPGLYKISGTIDVNALPEGSQIISINGEKYLVVPHNDLRGYLVVKSPYSKTGIQGTVPAGAVIGLYGALANDYGIAVSKLLDEIVRLQNKVSDLTADNIKLKDENSQLNQTVENLKAELGKYKAVNANLTSKILDLENQIKKLKHDIDSAILYAIAGVVSIAILVLILYYAVSKSVKKR